MRSSGAIAVTETDAEIPPAKKSLKKILISDTSAILTNSFATDSVLCFHDIMESRTKRRSIDKTLISELARVYLTCDKRIHRTATSSLTLKYHICFVNFKI